MQHKDKRCYNCGNQYNPSPVTVCSNCHEKSSWRESTKTIKMITKKEAIMAMCYGAKISRGCWASDYLYMNENGEVYSNHTKRKVTMNSFGNDEWFIYEDKPKFRVNQIVKATTGFVLITKIIYRKAEEGDFVYYVWSGNLEDDSRREFERNLSKLTCVTLD